MNINEKLADTLVRLSKDWAARVSEKLDADTIARGKDSAKVCADYLRGASGWEIPVQSALESPDGLWMLFEMPVLAGGETSPEALDAMLVCLHQMKEARHGLEG